MTAGDIFAVPFDSIAQDIRRLSFRHAIPEARLVEMLRSAEVANAPAGSGMQFDARRYLRALDRKLDSAGANSWIERVTKATGSEALFDDKFRFLAVSLAGRTLTGKDGQRVILPEFLYLGTSCTDFLPVRGSILGDGYPGFHGLAAKGFFDGALLGVQIDLDINFGFHEISGVMEFWAVNTLDRGVLGHSLIHSHKSGRHTSSEPGVRVNSVNYVWTRSH